MDECINLRLSEMYWQKFNEDSRQKKKEYDFTGYAAELRTFPEVAWGSEMLSPGGGCTSPAAARGTLEEIAHITLLFKNYSRMKHPNYNILLWGGECPMKRHKRERTGLLTKTPKQSIILELAQLFDSYYALKELVSEKKYIQAFEYMSISKTSAAFLFGLSDNKLRNFYIGLRKEDMEKAEVFAGFFSPKFYYELETAYLHHLEGRPVKGRSKLRAIEIFVV